MLIISVSKKKFKKKAYRINGKPFKIYHGQLEQHDNKTSTAFFKSALRRRRMFKN